MESKVQFVVDADMAKAIQNLLKVSEAQAKTVTGFENVARSGKAADDRIGGMVANLGRLAVGFASIQTAKVVMEAWVDSMERGSEQAVALKRDIAGLVIEGNNAFRVDDVRKQVLTLSSAWNRPAKEMADSMATIQKAFGELGEGKGKVALDTTLQLNQALGGSADATDLVTKAMQAYGPSLDNVGKATDKLFTFYTALSTVEEPSQFFAAAVPDALRASASFDDLTGSLVLLNSQGGRTRETAAAAKALFKGVADAIDEGMIANTHDFYQELLAISKLDPDSLKKLFGEGHAGVLKLLQDLPRLRAEIDKLKGAQGGQVSSRQAALYGDRQSMTAAAIEAANSTAENLKLPASATLAMTKLGAKADTGAFGQSIGFDWVKTRLSLLGGAMSSGPGVLENKGINLAIRQAEAGGNYDLADALRLEYGKVGMGVVTGPAERKEFEDLRTKNPGLTLEQYQNDLKSRRAGVAPFSAGTFIGNGRQASEANAIPDDQLMIADPSKMSPEMRKETEGYYKALERAGIKMEKAAHSISQTADDQKRQMLIDNPAHRE